MKEIKTSTPHLLRLKRDANPTVISGRLQSAFPELTEYFSWLNGGVQAGADGQALLRSYLKRIGPSHTAKLTSEVHDVLVMGLTKERDVETLVYVVLGLNRTVLANEANGAVEFLIMLRDQLLNVMAVS